MLIVKGHRRVKFKEGGTGNAPSQNKSKLIKFSLRRRLDKFATLFAPKFINYVDKISAAEIISSVREETCVRKGTHSAHCYSRIVKTCNRVLQKILCGRA